MAQSITVRSFAAGAQPITRSVDRSLAASKIPKSPHTYTTITRAVGPVRRPPLQEQDHVA
jgi:hypothetical protein